MCTLKRVPSDSGCMSRRRPLDLQPPASVHFMTTECTSTSTWHGSKGRSCTTSRSAIRSMMRARRDDGWHSRAWKQPFHRPRPTARPQDALALARHWSVIQIGATTPPALDQWRIVSREFRENLQWAVVVRGDADIYAAVATLLDELLARGISIRHSGSDDW